jgi:uncharacterized protein (DUF433 family)
MDDSLQAWARDRVVSDQGVLGGAPRIRGTRLAVADIVGFLAAGEQPESILQDYPYLTAEDLLMAPRYVRDR